MNVKECKNQSIDELKKIKKIISIVIDFLQKNIDNIENGTNINILDKQKNMIKFLIGSRENVVSTITKLINIITKINTLENIDNVEQKEELEDIDIEILERYIQNFKKN